MNEQSGSEKYSVKLDSSKVKKTRARLRLNVGTFFRGGGVQHLK